MECRKCKIDYPLEPQYWVKDARCRDGLSRLCLKCEAARLRILRREKPETMREYSRRSYKNNQDRVISYKNRPDVKIKHYESTKKWRAENQEEHRAQSRRCSHRRRMKERQYDGLVMTEKQFAQILEQQAWRCLCCGRKFTEKNKPTRDHICPISKGGGLEAQNVQADRKSTRLNSSHIQKSRMPSSA